MTSSHLLPLRVDVTDGPVRVVDTLLFDPTCWPLPLRSLEENAKELAHCIVSDYEVQSMGRTSRHFTGRVDLWNKSLHAKVARQLQCQLESIDRNQSELRVSKKRRLEETGSKETKNDSNHQKQSSDLIHIKIRLMVNGIVIKEDFDWDPFVGACPIAFAKQLAADLNLPAEGAVAIATAIVEQVHGVTVTDEPGMLTEPLSKVAAWSIDTKDQVATIANVVAQHRPTSERTLPT